MPGIFTSLANSAGALSAFSQALSVTQNNVANASTPGYVKQSQTLSALPFDPSSGASGGVKAGAITSARDDYAEKAVWRENVSLGMADQQVETLTALNGVFDVTGDSGIPYALNSFYQSASAFAQSPTDNIARQTLLDRAGDVATAFQRTAATLNGLRDNSEGQLKQTVSEINQLVSQLAQYNDKAVSGTQNDGGLDAQIYSTLQDLSQYADITAVKQDGGTMMVLIDGQYPLLVGQKQFPLTVSMQQAEDPTNPGAAPTAHIMSGEKDLSEKITTGRLGALLQVRNELLPSLTGDAYQEGSLNTLAKQFADRVNSIFTSGYITDGDIPAAGVPLFTYDQDNPTAAAGSLAVDSTVTPTQLAAIDPGPPYASNGIPLRLSALANSQDSADKIDGASYTEYYARIASKVGADLSAAQDEQSVQQASVAQAKDLRQQMSGVSLDEEAMILVQFQRGYQACSRLITVLDQLTEATINMLS
jgi:flagellar hook-associated protein 1